jgi:cobalamin synthase
VLLAVAGVAAVIVAGAASRMLRGVTGDTYGAAIEIAQATVVLAIVAAGTRGWLDPTLLT